MQAAISVEDVISQAIACTQAYTPLHAQQKPTEVVDMSTTGDIPDGYTHLIFVGFGSTGYVVSRNLSGRFNVEICDQITHA